ncbi:hypothetical protein ACFL7D_08905 [candidate division KSB1 bacterium]
MKSINRIVILSCLFLLVILVFTQRSYSQISKSSVYVSFGTSYLPESSISKDFGRNKASTKYLRQIGSNRLNNVYSVSINIPFSERTAAHVEIEYLKTHITVSSYNSSNGGLHWLPFYVNPNAYLSVANFDYSLIPMSLGVEYSFKPNRLEMDPFLGIGISGIIAGIQNKVIDNPYESFLTKKIESYIYGFYLSGGFAKDINNKVCLKITCRYRNTGTPILKTGNYGSYGRINSDLRLNTFDVKIGLGYRFK